ncbi:MAG: thioredoxin-disulfide reductase [Alphaproteobacteria bacterium]
MQAAESPNAPKATRENVIIIGSGPAGYTAAIYAARANLNPIMLCGLQPGGQLTITTDVENYPGFADAVQGPELMQAMEQQARNVGTQIEYDLVSDVEFSPLNHKVICDSGKEYLAKTVIITTGASAKWLGLDSESHFQGFGVSACATCDGFFFKNKIVAVVGGGNSAVEEALYLTNHASKVYVIHRRDQFRAEKILIDRLHKNPKIEVIWNHQLQEVIGSDHPKSVTGAVIQSALDQSTRKIELDGIFIAIGHKPATTPFIGKVTMDAEGYIITKPDSTQTNIEGVYAAGDVKDKIYRQAVTAAGMGCMAALEAEKYLGSVDEN